jgi:diaminohydroxyphosphoribosylaminopyrimidine deaminase / 5-amino-6-(5-phosphoribosylamino)uracil reductase
VTDLVRAPGDSAADQRWLSLAIRLSQRCERSDAAFSVGAILVAASGDVIATGWSRESDPADHAEELALRRATDGGARPDLADGGDLGTATLYSSLEPCCRRSSRSVSCAELIVAAGIRRVVIAWREPPIFQPGGGLAWLTGKSVAVVEVPGLAGAARAVNAHLLGH